MAEGIDIGALLRKRLGSPAPQDAPDEGAPEDAGDPLRAAMTDFADAMKAGDIDGMCTAFETACQAVEMKPDMETGEQE